VHDGAAVIADGVHLDQAGAAGADQMLAQPFVGLLGLLVTVGADKAVENLTQRQWQMIGILAEHGIYPREQGKRFCPWRPVGKSACSHAAPLCATK
jgi:hypothetical protein